MNNATGRNYPRFSGCFYKLLMNPEVYGDIEYDEVCADVDGDEIPLYSIDKVYIKGVRYNAPATIVFWSDGTKTISKCSPNDVYTPETGLIICIAKKLFGSYHVRTLFEEWLPVDEFDENTEYPIDVKLADVRRTQKLLDKFDKMVESKEIEL